MNVWPSTIQNFLSRDSFKYDFGETSIETEMDYGLKKKRRRFTKRVDELSCSIWLKTPTEYNTFNSFYDTTLNGGVDTFQFTNPISGNLEEFRFKDTPKLTYIGGDTYKVDMNWIKIP